MLILKLNQQMHNLYLPRTKDLIQRKKNIPTDKWRNNNVSIASKRRRDVIMTLLLRRVSAGIVDNASRGRLDFLSQHSITCDSSGFSLCEGDR